MAPKKTKSAKLIKPKTPKGTPKFKKNWLKEIGVFTLDILYNALVIIILVVLIRTFLISPFRVIGSSMADTLASDEFILINKLSYRISEPKRGDPIVFKPPITSKYPPKFEELVQTDAQGVGHLKLSDLTSVKNVPYCQNKVSQLVWLCHNTVRGDDLIYYQPSQSPQTPELDLTWKNAKKISITGDIITAGEWTFAGLPNTSYLIRIYDSRGPEYFVKRIIGIPGDTVKVENGRVYLKKGGATSFEEVAEAYLNDENKNHTYLQAFDMRSNEFTVPQGHYFVLGDNRNHSNDSRSWYNPIDKEPTPFVTLDNISGKVLMVLWPLPQIRFILN